MAGLVATNAQPTENFPSVDHFKQGEWGFSYLVESSGMEAQFEILVAMYIESAAPEPVFTQAALTKGGEIGLSEQQTYLVLEGLKDGQYIQVGRVSCSGSGEINYYPVRRLTALGTDTAVQYARTIEDN